MKVVDLGRVRYGRAEKIQTDRLERVQQGGEETLFLLEHEPVVTIGRNGNQANLHVSPDHLAAIGVDLHRISRGGDVTCHFPGQLVAYPIFRLDKRPGGVRDFFRDLEETAIQTLEHFQIQGQRIPGKPGVWVGQRKIVSIGVGVRKWVSYHGLALNVKKDLGLFNLITLCGLDGVEPTSIELELERKNDRSEVSMREVRDVCVQCFKRVFAAA